MDASAIRKQLKIKMGAMKRLSKEHNLYTKEAEELKGKLAKFKAESAEDWDINNTTRMMEESSKMITDSGTRLSKVVEELQDLVASAKKIGEMDGDEELVNADKALKEVK